MADGQVLIDSKLDTGGVTKGANKIEKEFDQLAKAAEKTARAMEQQLGNIDVSDAAQGLSESFESESQAVENAVDNAADSVERDADRMADAMEDSADDQSDAMRKAWDKTESDAGSGSRKVIDDIDDIGDKARSTGNEIESSLGKAFSGLASKIGGIMGTVFAVEEIFEFGKEAVNLGSDLVEVQNVVDTVFKDGSGEIDKFAKDAIKQFGLSELSAKQFTSTMGAMLDSMGDFDQAELVDMSTTLAGLAGDMASFYNLDAQEAFDKLRSGISGETEPLKQLGINLSAANLEAFALANGIEKTYDKMTEQEKALLHYNYILDATASAQGDFTKTQDSWANKTRILTEEFNSLKGTLGQGLINVLNPLVTSINASLMPTLQGLADKFLYLTESFNWDELIGNVNFGPIMASLGNLGSSISGLADTIGSGLKWAWDNVLVPFGGWAIDEGLPSTINALASAFDFLKSVLDGLGSMLESVWTWLEPIFSFGGDLFTNLMDGLGEFFVSFQELPDVWNNTWSEMAAVFAPTVVEPTVQGLETIENKAVETNVKVAESSRETISSTGDTVTATAEATKAGIDAIGIATVENANQTGTAIRESYNTTMEAVQSSTAQTTSQMATDATNAGNEIVNTMSDTAGSISVTAAEPLQESMTAAAEATGEAFDNAADTMKSAFGDMGTWFESNVATPVKTSIESMSQSALSMWASMESATTTAWANMVRTVEESIQKMQNKINSLTGKTVNVTVNKTGSGANLISYSGYDGEAYSPAAYTVTPQIPYLATGAVIPPNAPFLAMLGDQRNGTNIEAPMETIKQGVREVLEEMGFDVDININFVGELSQLIRILYPHIEIEKRRKGTSLAEGVTT